MKRYIAYLRVSTNKQGIDGLGIEAQRQAIKAYNGNVLKEFVEVESGKRNDRPELAKALEYCKLSKSVLIVAKLDRLARNVAFISSLMESGVEFLACDFPEANRLMLHILAAVAEHERELVSARTRAALEAAKKRGVRLGNPNLTDDARAAGRKSRSKNADEFAKTVYPTINALREQGLSLRGIAGELNLLNVHTPLNKQWTATAVRNALARA